VGDVLVELWRVVMTVSGHKTAATFCRYNIELARLGRGRRSSGRLRGRPATELGPHGSSLPCRRNLTSSRG
jgi:hypothetical protein